jgi:hypothetical protein
MLSPNVRSLYTSALTPPPGLVFDQAVATTFSMDPALLLEAPVHLALMAADGQVEPDPLSVLEAVRRYSKRMTVYVQRGRIQVPEVAKPNPLYGFLEDMVVEVNAPNEGVFHPKVWAIRFVGTDHDIGMLPGLAARTAAASQVEQAARFSEELHRVQWELPEGFDELNFFLPGQKEFDWDPPVAKRMVVISPFCSDEALTELASKAEIADALISRSESMSKLRPETLQLFTRRLSLDDAAETEDGEEENAAQHPLATGLHAKVYLFETRENGNQTHVVMGSANATNAALVASRNVEILVELKGRRSRVGGIDQLLSADGMGEYLVEFDSGREAETDPVRQKAEEAVERARSLLSGTALSINCSPGSKDGVWSLVLLGEIPPLEGIVSASAWPITVARDFAVGILPGQAPYGTKLGEYSASSITGLIAFELKTSHPDIEARFVLNLPVAGMPEERNAAILQTVISNKDGFLRYLLLLMGGDEASGFDPGRGTGFAKWLARLADGEDIPLLEELTRTYSRHPERMAEISNLVRDLSGRSQQTIIPGDFMELWAVFESAMGKRDA